MLARVEVFELVDTVEHVGDELAQEDAGGDPDVAAQTSADGGGEFAT